MKIETKSILAKLLATENISVEQKDIPTAAFDPTSRTLYIPKWKDMSNSLQDLLIGHEVGHAWDTPAEGWHDAVCSDRTLKPFLNIIEDARIERNIKSRYPGLVKSFYAGYRELFERDFFGVKDVDVDSLPLIDRINLHFKVGPFLGVKFSAEEKSVVDRCAKTETWEDVEALARELHGKAQETAEEDMQNIEDMFGDLDDDMEGEGNADSDDLDDSDDDMEGEGNADSDDLDDSDDDTDLEEGFGGSASDQDPENDDDNESDDDESKDAVSKFMEQGGVGSITDETFREKESELVNTAPENQRNYNVTIPKNINLDTIVPSSELYGFDKFEISNRSNVEAYAESIYKDFTVKNKSIVNQMASAFEMKRKASLFVKAKTAKTGDLDDKRLWSYKTSDNLFKQITSIPEGKNHGMVMYLDMSGSMNRIMAGTIEQLINLSMFCRKVNIPFEVYGFTTTSGYAPIVAPMGTVDGDMNLSELKMSHLLSSSFTKQQTEMAYKCLLLWRDSFTTRYDYNGTRVYLNSNALGLGATPLNATIVTAIEIAKQFRAANNLEVLSTIFLTDGDATDGATPWKESAYTPGEFINTYTGYHAGITFKYGSAVIPAYKTGHCHTNTKITATLLDLYKDVTGSKVINYHLVSRWTPSGLSECRGLFTVENKDDSFFDWDNIVGKKSSGIIEVKDNVGFDVRYLVRASSLNIDDSELEVKSNTKADLLKGFRKFAGNKAQSRVFVQKFIPQVS